MAIMNDTAINTRVQVLCDNKFSFLRNKFPGVLLLCFWQLYGKLFFFFFEEASKLFSRVTMILYSN